MEDEAITLRMDILSVPHSFHPVQHPHEVDSVMVESMHFTGEETTSEKVK